MIPSQELPSFFPHPTLRTREWRQVVRVHWGQSLAAVVWERAERSIRLHLCTMSHIWRCNRMLILLYLYNTRASSTPFGEGGRDAKVVLAEGGGADKNIYK